MAGRGGRKEGKGWEREGGKGGEVERRWLRGGEGGKSGDKRGGKSSLPMWLHSIPPRPPSTRRCVHNNGARPPPRSNQVHMGGVPKRFTRALSAATRRAALSPRGLCPSLLAQAHVSVSWRPRIHLASSLLLTTGPCTVSSKV